MRLIHRTRQGGKTTYLLRQMARDERTVMVVADQQQVNHARRLAILLGIKLEQSRFLTADAARTARLPQDTLMLVDNLEDVLARLMGGSYAAAATFSGVIDTKPVSEHGITDREERL